MILIQYFRNYKRDFFLLLGLTIITLSLAAYEGGVSYLLAASIIISVFIIFIVFIATNRENLLPTLLTIHIIFLFSQLSIFDPYKDQENLLGFINSYRKYIHVLLSGLTFFTLEMLVKWIIQTITPNNR